MKIMYQTSYENVDSLDYDSGRMLRAGTKCLKAETYTFIYFHKRLHTRLVRERKFVTRITKGFQSNHLLC